MASFLQAFLRKSVLFFQNSARKNAKRRRKKRREIANRAKKENFGKNEENRLTVSKAALKYIQVEGDETSLSFVSRFRLTGPIV